jgi:hypothetical protein
VDRLTNYQKRNLRNYRTAHAFQEIGVLLVAFTPLDGVLGANDMARNWRILLALLVIGVVLFELGVWQERRIHDRE